MECVAPFALMSIHPIKTIVFTNVSKRFLIYIKLFNIMIKEIFDD
jgi:hypothetical protein